jgi:crossover junction endodeoxyribonuclease RuvC
MVSPSNHVIRGMLILGIDPGSRITGYGLIRKESGKTLHVENGGIYTADAPTFPERLVIIYKKVGELIKQFSPDVIAVEDIFYSKNVKSTVKLGHARGVALLVGSLSGLPIFEYTPLQIKQGIVGYGHATKDQVQQMVKRLLNLKEVAEENASDALAVALCHAYAEKMTTLMKQAQ